MQDYDDGKENTLETYNIQRDSLIFLALSLKGGAQIDLKIELESTRDDSGYNT